MKPGAVVAAFALVVSACAGFGDSATPDLYAVCSNDAEATAADFLMGRGWVRRPDQDGPFHVALDRAPLASWDPAEADGDAAAIVEHLGVDRPRMARDYEQWVVLSRSDDRMLLGGIGSHDRLGAVIHAAPDDDGEWTRRFARRVRCGVRVIGLGFWEAREWQLDPQIEPAPSDSELAIRFYEGCPGELAAWEVVPVVFANDEVVMITITVTPPPNAEAQFCELGFAFSSRSATVDLGHPIGDRTLLDGSSFPMQLRRWPPPLLDPR